MYCKAGSRRGTIVDVGNPQCAQHRGKPQQSRFMWERLLRAGLPWYALKNWKETAEEMRKAQVRIRGKGARWRGSYHDGSRMDETMAAAQLTRDQEERAWGFNFDERQD